MRLVSFNQRGTIRDLLRYRAYTVKPLSVITPTHTWTGHTQMLTHKGGWENKLKTYFSLTLGTWWPPITCSYHQRVKKPHTLGHIQYLRPAFMLYGVGLGKKKNGYNRRRRVCKSVWAGGNDCKEVIFIVELRGRCGERRSARVLTYTCKLACRVRGSYFYHVPTDLKNVQHSGSSNGSVPTLTNEARVSPYGRYRAA